MADESQHEPLEEQPASTGDDVDMSDNGEDAPENTNNSELPFAEGPDETEIAKRTEFVDYLRSPIVTLLVGNGVDEAILTAHQELLVQSPFFAEACAAFTDDGSVSFRSSFSAVAAPS